MRAHSNVDAVESSRQPGVFAGDDLVAGRFVIYPGPMVTPHITKNPVPKNLHHLLRFADLEHAAVSSGNEALFLSVSFSSTPSTDVPGRRKSIRKGRRKTGQPGPGWEYHEMLEIHHHPDAARVMAPAGTPWAGLERPSVLFANVLPLPRTVTRRFPRLRRCVADLLEARIAELHGATGPQRRWLLHVGLLPESAVLEIGVTTWTALRRNPEKIERVEIS